MHGNKAITAKEQLRARIFKQGKLDARAFKDMIVDKYQENETNGMCSALRDHDNPSTYMEDNILLNELEKYDLTVKEVLEANLKNLTPEVPSTLEKTWKDDEAYEKKIKQNQQSPVVRNLRSIVDVLKPKSYGMPRRKDHQSVPSRKSRTGVYPIPKQPAAVKNQNRSNLTQKEQMAAFLGAPKTIQDIKPILNSESSFQRQQDAAIQFTEYSDVETILQMPSDTNGLDLMPVLEATEVDSDTRESTVNQPTKNFSVPKLNVSGLMTRVKVSGSNIKNPHIESSRSPLNSQLANLNRSSSLNQDSTITGNMMNLSVELNGNNNHTEFDRLQSQTQSYIPKSVRIIIPSQPSESKIKPDEYNSVYKKIVHRYLKRNRNGKQLTRDPIEFNLLTERGYELKQERQKLKRQKKKAMKRQRSMLAVETTVKRDNNISSTESSLSSRSSVSFGGVPEDDLEHIADRVKMKEINDRRNERRAVKWQNIFEHVVNSEMSVTEAIDSNNTEHEVSSQSAIRMPPEISSKPNSAVSSNIEPHMPQPYLFSSVQKNIRHQIHRMEMKLKKRLLEDIDEEIPDECNYQEQLQKEQSSHNELYPHSQNGTELDQIEKNIKNMMQNLEEEINATNEWPYQSSMAQQKTASPAAQPTVPSYITNQASFIAMQAEMQKRIQKFEKSNTTSPRFYENNLERNNLTARLQTLDRGHIPTLLKKNLRVESLQKLAAHLRSKSLIPVDQARSQVPNAFNKNMPLDRVAIAVGKHILERQASFKAHRQESLGMIPTSDEMTVQNSLFSIWHQAGGNYAKINESSEKTTDNAKSKKNIDIGLSQKNIDTGHSNPNLSQKSFYATTNVGRHSDKLMQEVNAVMNFFVNSKIRNTDLSLVCSEKDPKEKERIELNISKPSPASNESHIQSQPETLMDLLHYSSVVDRSGLQKTQSSFNKADILNSDKTQSIFVESRDDLEEAPRFMTKDQKDKSFFAHPIVPQRAERKNNNENIDIMKELNNYENRIIEVTGAAEETINSTDSINHLRSALKGSDKYKNSPSPSSRDTKTHTVLLKGDNSTQLTQYQLGKGQDSAQFNCAQDEKLFAMFGSSRYQETEKNKSKKTTSPQHKKKFQISIRNQKIPQKDATSAAFDQRHLASVSVKNIELPSEYSLSTQQMPWNQRIAEANFTSTSAAQDSIARSLGEATLALQVTATSHDKNQQHSWFTLHQQQQFIEPQNTVPGLPKASFPVSPHKQHHLMMINHPLIPDKEKKVSNMTIRQIDNMSPVATNQSLSPSLMEITRQEEYSSDESETSQKLQESINTHVQQKTIEKKMSSFGRQHKERAESVRQQRRQQVQLNGEMGELVNKQDPLKIKGRASNMHVRVEKPSRNYEDDQQANKSGGTTTTYIYLPQASAQQRKSSNRSNESKLQVLNEKDASADNNIYETIEQKIETGHQNISDCSTFNRPSLPGFQFGNNINETSISPLFRNEENLNVKVDSQAKTKRVVRNFKPSKPKKLPELGRKFEQKMDKLADANVSPLGLFNQDMHARREWNKLLSYQNISQLNEKQVSSSGDGQKINDEVDDSANKNQSATTQDLVNEKNIQNLYDLIPMSGDNSFDNSTLETHTTPKMNNVASIYTNIYKKSPAKIHLVSQKMTQNSRKATQKPHKKPTMCSQSSQTNLNKYAIYNSKEGYPDLSKDGYPELSKDILSRKDRQRGTDQRNMTKQPFHGPGLLTSKDQRSPKRNSFNIHNDSVSIYTRAKVALANGVTTQRNSRTAFNSDVPMDRPLESRMKDERSRYESTIRQRATSKQNPQTQQAAAASLSTQKFLLSRHQNPVLDKSMMSSKVSPFKPLGGGFKQNITQDVSSQRIEQELVLNREMLNTRQSHGWKNHTRDVSYKTFQQWKSYEDAPLGFNIEQKQLTQKPVPTEIKSVPEEDCSTYREAESALTREKIERSMLQLNQQLLEFKASEISSVNDEPRSHNGDKSNFQPTLECNIELKRTFLDSQMKSSDNNNSFLMGEQIISKAVQNSTQRIKDNNKLKLRDKNGHSKYKTNSSPRRVSPIGTNTLNSRNDSSSIPQMKKTVIGSDSFNQVSLNYPNRFMHTNYTQFEKSPTFQIGFNHQKKDGSRIAFTPLTNLKQKQSLEQSTRPTADECTSSNKQQSPKAQSSIIKFNGKEKLVKKEHLVVRNRPTERQSDTGTQQSQQRIRTVSQGISQQNIFSSQTDLSTKKSDGLQPIQPSRIRQQDRQSSLENLHLFSSTSYKIQQLAEESIRKRQIVNLPLAKSYALQFPSTPKEDQKQLITSKSKNTANISLNEYSGLNQAIYNSEFAGTPVECNQSELQILHECLQISEKGITDLQELINLKPQIDQKINEINGDKHKKYITSVAGAQIGAQNYRRKVNPRHPRRHDEGVLFNYKFTKDDGVASLNRILGTQKIGTVLPQANRKRNNRKLTVHMEQHRQSEARQQTMMLQGPQKTEDLKVNSSTVQLHDPITNTSRTATITKQPQNYHKFDIQ